MLSKQINSKMGPQSIQMFENAKTKKVHVSSVTLIKILYLAHLKTVKYFHETRRFFPRGVVKLLLIISNIVIYPDTFRDSCSYIPLPYKTPSRYFLFSSITAVRIMNQK